MPWTIWGYKIVYHMWYRPRPAMYHRAIGQIQQSIECLVCILYAIGLGFRSPEGCPNVWYRSSAGRWIVTDWYWSRRVNARSHYVTSLFEIPGCPSVLGWNTADMSSIVCDFQLMSTQKSNVDSVSLSLRVSQQIAISHCTTFKTHCADSVLSMASVQLCPLNHVDIL